MPDQQKSASDMDPEKAREVFEQHVEQCLSMVLHHPEVQEIAAIIKRIKADHQVGGSNEH